MAVLVLEESPELSEALRRVLSDIDLVITGSVPEARRKMISEVPELVLCYLSDSLQAHSFETSLKEHPTLRTVPVVIFSGEEKVSDGEVRSALRKFFPELAEERKIESASTKDEHFQFAQKLLAQVLHNLKTSNLLEVAEREDVPRIVAEMARKVCDAAIRRPANRESVDLESIFKKK